MNRVKWIFCICIYLTSYFDVIGQNKVATANRTQQEPEIDGKIDEIWNNANPINDFTQHSPQQSSNIGQKTEVRFMYDNRALYILAFMYDSAPDSILMQLGSRDESPNADRFSIKIDTYNNLQDAYVFEVYSSGVQADSRLSDDSFNAVWESKVITNEKGWIAEIKIPFSAIRFPKIDSQTWRIQLVRNIRRTREIDYWAPVIKEAENEQVYWGVLQGIAQVNPPLRLSFTPYLSTGIEHNAFDNSTSKSINGGLDLKYGINESFTLDMTLLPDFSQVQSDDKIKNLSAFETVYSEQRPFFNEAVDLFEKGNLFYSRRIGKTPQGFYSLSLNLDSGEAIIKNPTKTNLLNSFKISGRNKNGLAIGILNAIVGNTYATVNDVNNNKKRVLTDEASNYNVLVFDQALKNNSSIYVANSSFLRISEKYSSNVTASGVSLIDKSNRYRLNMNGGYSTFYQLKKDTGISINDPGYKYGLSFSKINGKFQYGISHSGMNDSYNANDVGLTLYNNYFSNNLWINYYYLQPEGSFLEYRLWFNVSNEINFLTQKNKETTINLKAYGTLKNHLSLWGGSTITLLPSYDYYEPRLTGYYFIKPNYQGIWFNFSSDYRKALAIDGGGWYYYSDDYKANNINASLTPIWRVNNHFIFSYTFSVETDYNDVGFATFSDDYTQSIFGKRDVAFYTQILEGRYVFINDLSLGIRARHYISDGKYHQYFILNNSGKLNETSDSFSEDFRFTSFNVDVQFNWQFSPGSLLSVVWKNEIINETNNPNTQYFDAFNKSFQFPARNIISLKFLYYLDYLYLRK